MTCTCCSTELNMQWVARDTQYTALVLVLYQQNIYYVYLCILYLTLTL